MIDDVVFSPIDFGDEQLCLLTAEEFAQSCKAGHYNDYDGVGCWATETSESDVEVSPSGCDNKPTWATHVVWYNK